MKEGHEIWYLECYEPLWGLYGASMGPLWGLYEPLMAAARELARYKLDLVGVKEVRWEKRAQ
jgi:hypothetical protein